MLGPGNECYNSFSLVEALAIALFEALDKLLAPVPVFGWTGNSVRALDDDFSTELVEFSVAVTFAPGKRLGLLAAGGGWPGAFFNCQLLSSTAMNFFRRSRY